MNVESRLEERNEERQKVKSIEEDIKKNIKNKFKKSGIEIKKVNIESSATEFDVLVDRIVEREELMRIEDKFVNLQFSAIEPQVSDRFGSVMIIYFN